VDFKGEKDFKFFILVSGNYLLAANTDFKEVYGNGIIYPGITAGWKFSRYFYLWSGCGLFSKSGKSRALEVPTRWRQQHLGLGLGYFKNLTLRSGWKAELGAVWVDFSEKWTWTVDGVEFTEEVPGGAIGARADIAWIYKAGKRLFAEISLGYLLASDAISIDPEADTIKVKLGGIGAGFGLGWRF
jgi:hypothetical protein